MKPEQAIVLAKTLGPSTETGVAENDPQSLEVGMLVTVHSDVDGGEQPVEGEVRRANAETIAIDRTSEETGTVNVHFPRAGYRIEIR